MASKMQLNLPTEAPTEVASCSQCAIFEDLCGRFSERLETAHSANKKLDADLVQTLEEKRFWRNIAARLLNMYLDAAWKKPSLLRPETEAGLIDILIKESNPAGLPQSETTKNVISTLKRRLRETAQGARGMVSDMKGASVAKKWVLKDGFLHPPLK